MTAPTSTPPVDQADKLRRIMGIGGERPREDQTARLARVFAAALRATDCTDDAALSDVLGTMGYVANACEVSLTELREQVRDGMEERQ